MGFGLRSDEFGGRCRQLYRCQQLNQDISELFSLADQSLFSSLQKNSHHVLHRLLPAKSTQPTIFVLADTVFPLLKNNQVTMTVISSPACYFTISTDWTIS